jgi:hypothetical protein
MTTLRVLNFIANALAFIYDATDCFIEHFVALTVLIYVAGEFTGRFWYRWHSDWIGTIDWSQPTPPAPPAINPLFDVATELEQFSCNQIRQTFGLRQRVSKTKLIAAAIAC